MTNAPRSINDLTYDIINVLFDVYNALGYGYREKQYYLGIKLKLLERGFRVQEQLFCKIEFSGQVVGKYFLDFLVSDGPNSVVLEIKVADAVYPQHIKQVINYLHGNNLKLGLIGVFSKNGVIVKRVIH